MKIIKNLFIVCLVIFMSVGVTACDFFTNNNSSEQTEEQETNTTNYIQKNIGETFTFEGVEITITEYKIRECVLNWKSANDYSSTVDNNRNKVWVEIYATITNNTTKDFSISSLYDKLVYVTNDGEATYSGSYYYEDEFIESHSTIQAFNNLSGIFAYKIPVSIAPSLGEEKQYFYNDSSIRNTYSSNTCNNTNFEFRLSNGYKSNDIYVVKL